MRIKNRSSFARKLTGGLIGVALIGLAGCQTKDEKIDPVAGGGGLTGKWVSSDNVFSAQLDNGRFFSTANDTGEVLSEGTYIVISATEVQLNWQGRLSQQSNSAKCERKGFDILSCTDLAGKNFTLQKAAVTG